MRSPHIGCGSNATALPRSHERLLLQALLRSQPTETADHARRGNSPAVPEVQHDIQKMLAMLTSIERQQLAGIGIAQPFVRRTTGKSIEVNDALV